MCKREEAKKNAEKYPEKSTELGKDSSRKEDKAERDDIVESCPWLEAMVVDDLDVPYGDEKCLLLTDAGPGPTGKTDQDGVVRFEDVPVSKEYRIQLINVLEAYVAANEPVPEGWTPKPDAYRSKDGTTHKVWKCVKAAKQKIVVDQLSEQQKFEHFRHAYEDNHAKYGASFPRDFVNKSTRWEWAYGAVCNQHVNFFLGYWYNYNEYFTTNGSATFMAAITALTSAMHTVSGVKHRGYKEFIYELEATDYTYLYKSISANIKYLRICESSFSLNTGKPKATLLSQLAEYNVYSVSDLNDQKRQNIALGKLRRWLKNHPDKLPKGVKPGDATASQLWDIVWNLEENGDDKKLLDDMRTSLNVDHHAGILIKRGDDLYTFSADSPNGTLIKLKRFGEHDLKKRKLLHLAIWCLETLRDGGYAPQKTEKNEGGISIHHPSRFVWWKPTK